MGKGETSLPGIPLPILLNHFDFVRNINILDFNNPCKDCSDFHFALRLPKSINFLSIGSKNQTARRQPNLKDGVCFGPRALVRRNRSSSRNLLSALFLISLSMQATSKSGMAENMSLRRFSLSLGFVTMDIARSCEPG